MTDRPIEKNKGFSRKAVFIMAVCSALIINAVSAYVYFTEGAPDRLPPDVVQLAAGQFDINPRRDECHNMTLEKLDQSGGCVLGSTEEKDKNFSFMAFGDSFADTLAPELNSLSLKYGIKGAYASYSSCPPVLGIQRINKIDNPSTYHCKEFNDTVWNIIKKNKIRNVILFARWKGYTTDYLVSDTDQRPDNMQDSVGILAKNLRKTVETFAKHDINIWIITQPPEYKDNMPYVLSKGKMAGSDLTSFGMPESEYQEQRKETGKIISSLHGMKNLHMIDLYDLFCPEGGKHCLVEYNGFSLYRDNNHLSIHGVSFLAPLLESMIQEMAGGMK